MEIGSEFWVDEVGLVDVDKTPKWMDRFGDSVLTSSGRGALSLLLGAVEMEARIALLPAYICDSVISPFEAHGYVCQFYDIDSDLTPNLDCISNYQNVGLFLHMGYYGFPTNRGLSDIIKRLKLGGTIIVEDVTHTLFSKYTRFEANDYYVASIRKWMGMPSGGFLSSHNKPLPKTELHNDAFTTVRSKALRLKSRYMKNPNIELKSEFLRLFSIGEQIINNDVNGYCIDALSKSILYEVDESQLREKRRNNFSVLYEGLRDVTFLEPVFNELPDDICPMFFPVYIKGLRNEVQRALAEKGLYCPVHWPVPDKLNRYQKSNAWLISQSILSIPCDQRYSRDDMERVVTVCREITCMLTNKCR